MERKPTALPERAWEQQRCESVNRSSFQNQRYQFRSEPRTRLVPSDPIVHAPERDSQEGFTPIPIISRIVSSMTHQAPAATHGTLRRRERGRTIAIP